MTGPEHYRKAEALVADCKDRDGNMRIDDWTDTWLAAAQVHATLALAAATAIRPSDWATDRAEWRAWAEVASVEAAQDRAGGEVTS